MQQFDIVEILSSLTRGRYPFAVLLQHPRVSSIGTLVVGPLTESSTALLRSRLHPTIEVKGRAYVMITEELSGVQRRTLGQIVGSAEHNRYAIIAAIDLLFTGI